MLLAAFPFFLGDTPLEFLLSLPFRRMAAYPLALLLAVDGVRELLAVRKARRALAAGLTPEFQGDWRRSRRRWYLLAVLVVVCWLAYFGDIVWSPLADTDAIDPPIVSVTALVPDSGPEDWDLDLSHYRWSHTPLRPAHGELLRGGSGDRWVLTTGDSLRFSALAGPLYRERLAAQRRLWPAAVETAVQDPRFDEAILLEDGDSSYFLARRGRAVTSAQVDFPLDLTAHLDDFAAVLGGA